MLERLFGNFYRNQTSRSDKTFSNAKCDNLRESPAHNLSPRPNQGLRSISRTKNLFTCLRMFQPRLHPLVLSRTLDLSLESPRTSRPAFSSGPLAIILSKRRIPSVSSGILDPGPMLRLGNGCL